MCISYPKLATIGGTEVLSRAKQPWKTKRRQPSGRFSRRKRVLHRALPVRGRHRGLGIFPADRLGHTGGDDGGGPHSGGGHPAPGGGPQPGRSDPRYPEAYPKAHPGAYPDPRAHPDAYPRPGGVHLAGEGRAGGGLQFRGAGL